MVTFGLGMSAYLLITVLWMQNVWHWPVIKTGFALAPAPAMVPVVTMLAQRLARKIPARLPAPATIRSAKLQMRIDPARIVLAPRRHQK